MAPKASVSTSRCALPGMGYPTRVCVVSKAWDCVVEYMPLSMGTGVAGDIGQVVDPPG